MCLLDFALGSLYNFGPANINKQIHTPREQTQMSPYVMEICELNTRIKGNNSVCF